MSHLDRLVADLSGLETEAEYWDVRIEDTFETNLTINDGEIVTCTSSPSLGAFIRLRKNGFWLYESTTEIEKLRDRLMVLDSTPSRSGSAKNYQAERQPRYVSVNARESRFSAVPLERKVQLAQKYEAVLKGFPKIATSTIRYKDVYKTKSFLSSVGTQFEFDFNQGGFSFIYTLKDGDKLFQDFTSVYGSEFSQLEGFEEELSAYVKESEPFLDAPAITPGKYKILLDPDVTGVFTHESFGHKSEADFMIGNDQAMEDWKLGKKIGAECLTIVDYGGHAQTSGYCPIDDDGTPAQKNYLIKNGILTGRLHSRETAVELGEKPTGNSRAMNFEFEPIVRMTSTYIEAGTEPLDSIMKRCEGAILIEGYRHGSGLSTFTIAPTRGYRIGKNGEKTPVRLTVISGSVFDTLNDIEAVSSDFKLNSKAGGGCGKAEQWPLPVAHGGPFVLVKEMQVS